MGLTPLFKLVAISCVVATMPEPILINSNNRTTTSGYQPHFRNESSTEIILRYLTVYVACLQ